MRLTPCEGCGRHLYAAQTSCPFCGDTRPEPIGGLLPWVIAGLLGTVGCGPATTGDDGAPGGSSGEPGIETTDSTTMDPTTSPSPVGSSTGSSDDASAMTASSDGLDEAGDNPCGFYAGCSPDGGTTDFECDIVAQDCPEGEKCMPWANDGGEVWNASRCSPLAGDAAEVGEPCAVEGSAVSGIDDCALGSMCFGVDPRTNLGECVPMCSGTWDDPQCDAGQHCIQIGLAPVPLCADECNPLAFECTEGDNCTPSGDAFGCLPPSGSGGQGDPCEVVTGCDPGNVCVVAIALPECEDANCCTSYCDLAAPTCPDGLTCTAFYEEGQAPEGLQTLGACIVP